MIMLCSSVFVRATRHKLYSYITKNSLHTSAMSQAKVAVVLSGCGVYDGTEVHEASACLVHLSRAGAQVAFFAPDVNQMHVIDHLQGAPAEGETRSVRVESARIARGTVSALADLRTANFDAVVFPGGFGAAKNLSTFAVDGGSMKVNGDVERVIAEFRKEDKPIGLCCIAPVLAAKVLGDGVEVTIGNDAGTAAAIEGMGAKHCDRKVNESCVDVNKKVVTAPAYMYGDAKLHDIFDGIGAMIDNVLKLTR